AAVRAPVPDRVEGRAGPAVVGAAGVPEQVPGVVDLDREPRLLHPAAREPVRLVLRRRVADLVAERVELVEPVEDPAAQNLQPERVDRLRAGVDDHALRLEVEIERLEPQLAAEAGLLVAAERDPGEGRVRHVDADRTGLDPRRYPMPPGR